MRIAQDDAVSYLVHYNKQRVKRCRELLYEAKIILPRYGVGQGKRSDLTFVPQNKSGKAMRMLLVSEFC